LSKILASDLDFIFGLRKIKNDKAIDLVDGKNAILLIIIR
jgi:hypothetical protein